MINNSVKEKPVRCTIKDVAREANVSITTVSAVLRNTETIIIGENTKKRVIESVKKLNYHTNYNTCQLRSKQSCIIGLMVTDFSMPILSQKIECLIKSLDNINYSTIIRCSFGNSFNEAKVYEEFLSMDIDALIITGCSKHFADKFNSTSQANRIPILSLENIQPLHSDSVMQIRLWLTEQKDFIT